MKKWHAAVSRPSTARLAAAGVSWPFPRRPRRVWLFRRPNCNVYQQLFVATDGPATVRGGYRIKHEVYRIAGREERIGQIALPLSEGIIDHRFAQVGAQLLLHALRRSRCCMPWAWAATKSRLRTSSGPRAGE